MANIKCSRDLRKDLSAWTASQWEKYWTCVKNIRWSCALSTWTNAARSGWSGFELDILAKKMDMVEGCTVHNFLDGKQICPEHVLIMVIFSISSISSWGETWTAVVLVCWFQDGPWYSVDRVSSSDFQISSNSIWNAFSHCCRWCLKWRQCHLQFRSATDLLIRHCSSP